MAMRYFITGATGFIGSRLARRLLRRGDDVTALVRQPADADLLAREGARIIQGDIRDEGQLRVAMEGAERMFHLAAVYRIGAQDYHTMPAVNVEGTRLVLETAQSLGIARIVYTSSVAVFSDTQGKTVDESHHHPQDAGFLNEYERSKWLAHYQVAKPMIGAGLPLIIVMPSLVYGPNDTSTMGKLLQRYLAKQLPFIPKRTAYSWAYIDDVVEGHLLAMERGNPGEEYILSGPNASLEAVLELAQGISGVPAPRLRLSPRLTKWMTSLMHVGNTIYPLSDVFHPESLATVAGATYLASYAKAAEQLGYSPRSLREGLSKTLKHAMIHQSMGTSDIQSS